MIDGLQALEAWTRTAYDAILMDCRMPKMDGYEAAREIRRREGPARHIPIVALTAHALDSDKKKCVDAGMDDYLSKPVDLKVLAETLRRVTAHETAPASPAPTENEASTGNDGPVLDPATMDGLRAQAGLLPELIGTALAEMSEQVAHLADMLAAHNHADAGIAAHSLKGLARTFGAARMAELAAAVEKMAGAQATDQALAGLDQLKQECERVSRELNRERDALPANSH